jgi:hypothetical protein
VSGGLGQRKELLVVLGYRRHANLDARAVWWVNVFIVGLYEDLPTLDNEYMKMPTDSGMGMVCPPERYRGAQRASPSPECITSAFNIPLVSLNKGLKLW